MEHFTIHHGTRYGCPIVIASTMISRLASYSAFGTTRASNSGPAMHDMRVFWKT